MMVEIAAWLAVSVLRCDLALLSPTLFIFYLGNEVIDRPPDARLSIRATVVRVLRQASKTFWTVYFAAVAVLAFALLTGTWIGLTLIAVTVLIWRARRLRQAQVI